MPRGVGISQGIVKGVAVAVESLRVDGVRDEGVGAEEAVQVGQVVAGVHVDEAQVVGRGLVVVAVAGVAQAGDGLRRLGAPVAEGEVARGAVTVRAACPRLSQRNSMAQFVALCEITPSGRKDRLEDQDIKD